MNLNPFIILICQCINIYLFFLLIYIIINWLLFFKVINLNNLNFRKIYYSVEEIARVLLDKICIILDKMNIKKFINIDISPIIAYLLLTFIKNVLISYFYVR